MATSATTARRASRRVMGRASVWGASDARGEATIEERRSRGLERIAHFGLGPAAGPVHEVELEWPSGATTLLTNVPASQL
jgi:hypothetical protein